MWGVGHLIGAVLSLALIVGHAPVRPQALVTEETKNRIAVVDLPSGRITRHVDMPADPEFVAANGTAVVVVSPGSHAVSVLDRWSLRPIATLHKFSSPHIAEISPDGRYAYVTDDGSGKLGVIRLTDGQLVARIQVGAGAHHMGISPDGRRVWIALGESARTIVIVDSADPTQPRVLGTFDPGFAVHDLSFSPDGRQVWLTASDSSDLGVFAPRSHRLLFRVPGGTPPQHVVFAGDRAYVTSGYGDQIELVRAGSGRVVKTASAAHGAFNLSAGAGFVAASSLLDGTISIYDAQLHPLNVEHLAPTARDVAISPGR
jgi:DNA-binding beta-propeller fold protein YncE